MNRYGRMLTQQNLDDESIIHCITTMHKVGELMQLEKSSSAIAERLRCRVG